MEGKPAPGRAARWPLALIALPAAVAIWSGWVGLGELCGFGPVEILPGITGWTLNTAITLPIGAEAYAIYALHAYISPGTPERAKWFAFWSSIGAGLYGITGQVTFHLLTSAGRTVAPPPVVVFVSCMPVAVVMLAAVLTHLLNEPGKGQETEVHGEVPSSSLHAARMRLKVAAQHGFKVTPNDTQERFGLTRAAARGLHAEFAPEEAPAGNFPPVPAGVNGNGPHA